MNVLIVVATQSDAERIRHEIDLPEIAVITQNIRQLSGRTAEMIIVHPAVDLHANIDGEGRLEDLLRSRQRTFANPVFMRL